MATRRAPHGEPRDILLASRTLRASHSYKSVRVWYHRPNHASDVKTLLPDTAVTHENGNIVRYGGRRYRLWTFRRPRPGKPFARAEVAIQERRGLLARLKEKEGEMAADETAGFHEVVGMESYLSRGTRRGEKTYRAEVETLLLRKMRVAYYGVHQAETRVELGRSGDLEHAFNRSEIRFSPVWTEGTPERLCVYATIPRRVGTTIQLTYLFQDGTASEALRTNAVNDAYREDESKWLRQCSEEWVLVRQKETLVDGKCVYYAEDGHYRDETVFPSVVFGSVSTKAARIASGNPWLEEVMAQRGALKEALAVAVFAPSRVERMTEAYGEDWLERV
jgi:hypothetical protein